VLRKARGRMDEAGIAPLDWPVQDWVLVRSHLAPEGAGYEPLARFALEARCEG
jgi:2'-5' RNA ligase